MVLAFSVEEIPAWLRPYAYGRCDSLSPLSGGGE